MAISSWNNLAASTSMACKASSSAAGQGFSEVGVDTSQQQPPGQLAASGEWEPEHSVPASLPLAATAMCFLRRSSSDMGLRYPQLWPALPFSLYWLFLLSCLTLLLPYSSLLRPPLKLPEPQLLSQSQCGNPTWDPWPLQSPVQRPIASIWNHSPCHIAEPGGPARPRSSPSHSLGNPRHPASRQCSLTVSWADASNASAAWASEGQEANLGLFNNSGKPFSVLKSLQMNIISSRGKDILRKSIFHEANPLLPHKTPQASPPLCLPPGRKSASPTSDCPSPHTTSSLLLLPPHLPFPF